ncbi:MAG: FtsW/RodA/SpoVE family cell cycle protein [Oscillospiraceae bacterium]|jgi:rod shape determining protein RodA|nr:FtsW/RodA/SpoVE family cell cycle protein [Oscillospiraceae bacterium]
MQKTRNIGRNIPNKILNALLGYVKTTNIPMWITMLSATVFSCLLVYSATWQNGNRNIIVQMSACALGYTGAIILSTMDYEQLGELWYIVGGGCILLVAATYVLGFTSYEQADDRAWLNIFGVSFQPSELMKIGFIITFSYHLAKVVKAGQINAVPQLLMLLGHAMIPIGMILLQGDTGTAMVFMLMTVIMFFSSGISWKYIAAAFVLFLAALPILWEYVIPEFQKQRILVVYNPQAGDEADGLYQQTLGRMALGSGGVSGQGWRQGQMAQSEIIPEDYTDFIFTVAGEEFGFIGTSLIVIILLTIMIFTLRTAFKARDPMGRFMCMGFFGIVAIQTIFNLGMCLVVLPVIGITLPFFSAGGSSSMCLYFGFGLVLSVYARQNEVSLQI